jgi:cytochrome b
VGYGVAAAVAIRLIWGFVGQGHARFADFVPRPATLIQYLGQLFARKEPRYTGHYPAGSIMIIGLLGLLVAVSVTGWMMGLDRYFGNEALKELHEGFAMSILSLAGIHVLAAVIESVRHRENLIKSMITGRKRRPSGTDIDHAIDPH